MRASWDPELSVQDRYSVSGTRHHHLVNVVRLEAGEELLLLNGKGLRVLTRVEAISKKELHLTFCSFDYSEENHLMDLALGIPKKEALELCLKQATELGFRRIFFVRSEFAQSKWPDADRIQNVLVSALEQSNSHFLPVITVTDWTGLPWTDYSHILMLDSQSKNCQNVDQTPGPKALLIVGPEGGFSQAESAELHARSDIEIIKLPTPILRTPTAVAAGAGILLGRLLK